MSALTDLYAQERAAGAGHYAALRRLAHRTGLDGQTVANALAKADAKRERPAVTSDDAGGKSCTAGRSDHQPTTTTLQEGL